MSNLNSILPPEGETLSREELFNRLERSGIDRKWFGHKVKLLEKDQQVGLTVMLYGLVFASLTAILASNPVASIVGAAVWGGVSLGGVSYWMVFSVREHLYLKKKMDRDQITQERNEIDQRIYQARIYKERNMHENINSIDFTNQQRNLINELLST